MLVIIRALFLTPYILWALSACFLYSLLHPVSHGALLLADAQWTFEETMSRWVNNLKMNLWGYKARNRRVSLGTASRSKVQTLVLHNSIAEGAKGKDCSRCVVDLEIWVSRNRKVRRWINGVWCLIWSCDYWKHSKYQYNCSWKHRKSLGARIFS